MTWPLRPSRGRPSREAQKSRTSWWISSGGTPSAASQAAGSSSCTAPLWVRVSIRTVSPGRTRSTGSLSIGNQPQLTFSGEDGTKWSASSGAGRPLERARPQSRWLSASALRGRAPGGNQAAANDPAPRAAGVSDRFSIRGSSSAARTGRGGQRGTPVRPGEVRPHVGVSKVPGELIDEPDDPFQLLVFDLLGPIVDRVVVRVEPGVEEEGRARRSGGRATGRSGAAGWTRCCRSAS